MTDNRTTRRTFFAAAGATAAALATTRDADAATISELEESNEKLVNDFCAAWETLDVDKIGSFLAESCLFKIDGQPEQKGRDAIISGTKMFLANADSASFKVIRSAAMGYTVLNDRIDTVKNGNGELTFHVSGLFVVKDGKIQEWRDYFWPRVDED